jgi:purine-binding chemotaxis protein CheW
MTAVADRSSTSTSSLVSSLAIDRPTASAHALRPAAAAGDYLSFRLGSEEYGLDILRVQEIRSYEEPTHMAHAPHHVKGVVNLRGVIVPLMDLRLKLGLSEVRCDSLTVVVVLNVADRIIGMVVDSVSDVVRLDAARIKPVPALSHTLGGDFASGIGSVDQRMLILVDVEALIGGGSGGSGGVLGDPG